MARQELDFDRSLLGVEHLAGVFHVRKDTIVKYCRAIGEANPIHTDETAAKAAGHPALVAPPIFCTLFVRGFNRPDIKLRFGRTRFHAGEAIENLAPIYTGDTLTATTRLKEVYTKTGRSGAMAFVVWETSFANQHGQQVATVQETFVNRE